MKHELIAGVLSILPPTGGGVRLAFKGAHSWEWNITYRLGGFSAVSKGWALSADDAVAAARAHAEAAGITIVEPAK